MPPVTPAKAVVPVTSTSGPMDEYVYLFSDVAMREVLLELCRRFKGVDATVDAKIDAAAGFITGNDAIKTIPAHRKGSNRVPLYFEGEPGVGKTKLIEAAIRKFCEITGLNYVANPQDDYVMQPNDFYFCTTNLSGKTNTADFGGLPMRTEVQAQAAMRSRKKAVETGSIALSEIELRARGAAGVLKQEITDVKSYATGGLGTVEVTIRGDGALCASAVETVLKQISDDAKKRGVGITLLKDGAEPEADRISYQIKCGAAGARICVHAPIPVDNDAEYVASILPNLRFHLAKKTPFSLFNFDDVANANEQVRNVLLEVAQSNRYSGVMDIGNAMVTFTGNMGSDDNTNVMSRQSDAEVTRIRKFRVMDSPEDWANRVSTKYATSPVGDCHFASFIQRQGNNPGIFREAPGAKRGKRGVPKTNSRALENALSVVDAHFLMAHESNLSLSIFMDKIERDISATAGKTVATSFKSHLHEMITEAIPLAEEVITTGKLNEARFAIKAGQFRQTSEIDFGYRFATALADAAVNEIAFKTIAANEKIEDRIRDVVANMTIGLKAVNPTMMTFALTRMITHVSRSDAFGSETDLGNVLTHEAYEAITKGFATSLSNKIWGNAADCDRAKEDFLSAISGAKNTATSKKPVALKAAA